MREIVHKQLPLVPRRIDHAHADELQEISRLLDGHPRATALVYEDLVRGLKKPDRGRKGLSAEQVLRIGVARRMNEWSFEELSFQLADSASYRSFCRLRMDQQPKSSTVQRDVSKVRSETWEAINKLLLQTAAEEAIEPGNRARVDCTVTATDIHHPTDSNLLWDGVRVLVRLMRRTEERVRFSFTDHSRRAKRRMLAIRNVRGKERKKKQYLDLIKVAERTVRYASRAAEALDGCDEMLLGRPKALALAHQLRHYVELTERVLDQTRRRILKGESVPADEKLVSIFETHSDIIRKDNRETLYGHKLCLTVGERLVTDCRIPRGNPADVTLAVDMVKRQKQLFGRLPTDIAFDGGFASKNNLALIKELGVNNVSFSKRRGMAVSDMVENPRIYKKLRNFRAGIEAVISFLKRCFGLRRCLRRGFKAFENEVWSSIVAANLLMMARHRLASG